MNDFLILENITKSFGDEELPKTVLSNVEVKLGKGQVLAICGKSGVGKSTLLRVIAGLESPDSGQVKIQGRDPKASYPRIGFVSQDYSRSLLPWLSALSNVELALLGSNLKQKERRETAISWLKETGLLEAAKKKPWQLSGGMQQRVAFARAFAVSPTTICLDEPFASLDSFNKESLQDLVLTIAKKLQVTVVLVTHDMDEALYMGDKILVLKSENSGYELFDSILTWPRDQKIKSSKTFLKLKDKLVAAVSLEPS